MTKLAMFENNGLVTLSSDQWALVMDVDDDGSFALSGIMPKVEGNLLPNAGVMLMAIGRRLYDDPTFLEEMAVWFEEHSGIKPTDTRQ